MKNECPNKMKTGVKNPADPESKALTHYFNQFTTQVRNRTDVLFLVNLILHRCTDYTSYPIVEKIDPLTDQQLESILQQEIIFPDWVFDKHTKEGKKLNRGFKHFYEISAKLNNCYIDDPYQPIAKKINCSKD